MKHVTVDDIMGLDPCDDYSRDRVTDGELADLLEEYSRPPSTRERRLICRLILSNRLTREAWKHADGWRPIETAPRDGTWVHLWHRRYGCVRAQWSREREVWFPGHTMDWYMDDDVTHWRPLPEHRK